MEKTTAITMLLEQLLSAAPDPNGFSNVENAHQNWLMHWQTNASPLHAAVATGFSGERLAWAFSAGYQSALRALFPQLADCPDIVTLCVSEAGGNHPKAIKTQLTQTSTAWQLNGAKQWASMSDQAGTLLVAARTNGIDELRPALKLVQIHTDQAGVERTAMPPTPFTPEITHCRLQFKNVAVAESAILPGDGYSQYIKPFRLYEDCHVHAAFGGYLLRLARLYQWPWSVVAELLSCISSFEHILRQASDSAVTHVLYEQTAQRLSQIAAPTAAHWQLVDETTQQRWQRDHPLSGIAAKARAARLHKALLSLNLENLRA